MNISTARRVCILLFCVLESSEAHGDNSYLSSGQLNSSKLTSVQIVFNYDANGNIVLMEAEEQGLSLTSPTMLNGWTGKSFISALTSNLSLTTFAASGLPSGLTLDGGTGVISGAPANPGIFHVNVILSNDNIIATRSITIHIHNDDAPPSVVTQPLNHVAFHGDSISLSAAIEGSPSLKLQWQKNGVAISGATKSKLYLPHIDEADEGSYTLLGINKFGSVTTLPAAVYLDKDGNGLPDTWERDKFGDVPQLGTGDFDGDEVSNVDEYLERTDPTLDTSFNPRLTIVAPGGSTVASPAKALYSPGETVSITATPDDGNFFYGWGGAASGTEKTTSVQMHGHRTVYADFGTSSVREWGGSHSPPPGVRNVKAVAAGWRFALALKTDGTVVAWGSNSKGQCNVPAGLGDVVAIAAGHEHCLALKSNGSIVAWGDNEYQKATVPSGLGFAIAVSGSYDHSVALLATGQVVRWGGFESAYGNGSPMAIDGPICTSISSGGIIDLALQASGVPLIFYGSSSAYEAQNYFDIIAISGGYGYALGLRSGGMPVAWGDNFSGQCDVPVGLDEVIAVAAGSDCSLALKKNGRIVTWGNPNDSGFLDPYRFVPGLPEVAAISASETHAVAILEAEPTVAEPVIISHPFALANPGEPFFYRIAALNAATQFSATGLPSGLHLDLSSGIISGSVAALGTFPINLSASNAKGVGSMVLKIIASVRPPRVSFTEAYPEALEGGPQVNIAVRLSAKQILPVTVPFKTSGFATKGKDYTITSSPLVFAPGEAVKSIQVKALADTVLDFDEDITISLGKPTGAGAFLDSEWKEVLCLIVDPGIFPSVEVPPSSQIVHAGSTVHLTSTGSGTPPLMQQWYRSDIKLVNSVSVTGATSTALTLSPVTVNQGGRYRVRYFSQLYPPGTYSDSNPDTETQDPAELAVVERQTEQLRLAKRDSTLSLSANVGGSTSSLSFQWYLKRDADAEFAPLINNSNFSGVLTKSLSIKTFDDGRTGTTEEGIYYCMVTLKAFGQTVGSLKSTDFNARVAQPPDIIPLPAASGVMATGSVGTAFEFRIPRMSDDNHKRPVSYAASSLPPGLSLSTTTGILSGIPTASGDFKAVKITATNPAGTTTINPCWIHIDPVPANALGSFVALAARSGAHDSTPPNGTFGLGGTLHLKVLPNASYTGKLIIGTLSYPFDGKLNTSTANPTTNIALARPNKTSLAITLSFNAANNLLTGTMADASGSTAIAGWRNTWTAKNPATAKAGRHHFMATIPTAFEGDANNPGKYPQGASYAAATVTAATGVVAVSGKLSDGSGISGSSLLGPDGQFLVYQSLYKLPTATTTGYPGSLCGVAKIGMAGNPHGIDGPSALTWSKRPQLPGSTKVYPDGWSDTGPLSLSLSGDLYKAPVAPSVVLGASGITEQNAVLEFFGATSLELPSTVSAEKNPNLTAFRIKPVTTFVKPSLNPASVALVFAKSNGVLSTGIFSGSFKLIHSGAIVAQTVKFSGMLIPDRFTPYGSSPPMSDIDGQGVGYFLLPSTMSSGPTKSGKVILIRLP